MNENEQTQEQTEEQAAPQETPTAAPQVKQQESPVAASAKQPSKPETITMETATVSLIMGTHAVIHVVGATPAEALFLVVEHMAGAGKVPVTVEGEVTEIERSPKVEIQRLRSKYSSKKLGILFGKLKPELPTTFKEAIAAGVEFGSTTAFAEKEPLMSQTLI